MDNCEEASCDRGGSIGWRGLCPLLVRSVDVSSESLAALDGVAPLVKLRLYPDVILAVGCGAQAQMKGIWWMPWH